MQRIEQTPRPDWRGVVQSYGFEHCENYWCEAARYELTTAEVTLIEAATAELERMCHELVGYVVNERLYDRLGFTTTAARLIEDSWNLEHAAIYGRFDLSLGADGSLKLMEYNADTPTSLFEAAVAQWEWLQSAHPDKDQFNSIHERLIAAWARIPGALHFAGLDDAESVVTTAYMEDCARQAGLVTSYLTVDQIGWNGRRFVGLNGEPIQSLFKLYPWEWLLTDEFAGHVTSETRFFEPAWKMVLSNKLMLPLLHEMFPDSPYVLGATDHEPVGVDTWVKKPVLGREGHNVTIRREGIVVQETSGDYGDGAFIYQEFHESVEFDGIRPVIGSWVIDGEPAGVGIREDAGVTGNMARFVPHLISEQPVTSSGES